VNTETARSTREFFGVINADGYVPILLETLRVDAVPDFDLYNRGGRDYILYRRGEHPFTEDQRRSLIEHRVRALYVPADHMNLYWRYVKRNISIILSDPQMPPKRKAEVFHTSAIGLTHEVLNNPTSEEMLRTAGEIVKGSAQLLLEGRPGFHAFLNMVGKDTNLYSHAVNVCTYGIALARAVSLPPDRLSELGIGLLLHDLGMVGVPQEVFNKTTSLSEEEWEIIRGHPERGLAIYEETGGESDVARAVILHHHERMDGNGYPQGLGGASIPLVARIGATVNVFDALTTARPFRPALSSFAALKAMKQDLKTALDQDLVDQFIRILGPV